MQGTPPPITSDLLFIDIPSIPKKNTINTAKIPILTRFFIITLLI